jgi:hypothetical protein
MTTPSSEIKAIIDRILANNYTESDINSLRETIIATGNQNVLQKGRYNANISEARDIQLHLGDRIYQGATVEAIQEALCQSVFKGLSEGFKGLTASEFQGEYFCQESILHRHITGINEYSTLSFLEPVMPKKLTTILGIDNTPIIYTNNPVFELLEKFVRESDNESLITHNYHPSRGISFSYCINKNGYTKQLNGNRVNNFPQTIEDFENDTLEYRPGDIKFNYAPVFDSLQTSDDNGIWTCILEDEAQSEYGTILQYPKLSNLSIWESHKTNSASQNKATWIKQIIETNPETRGFFLFYYRYIKSLNNSSLIGQCGFSIESLASCRVPTPYLRFMDIKNIKNRAIKIESINFDIVKNSDYKLTGIDDRQDLFRNSSSVTQNINILLPPQHHLLIPLEFGFDTRAFSKSFFSYSMKSPKALSNFYNQKIYVSKIPDESSPFENFLNAIADKKLSLEELYFYMPEQINPLITESVQFSQDFLAKTQTLDELLNSVSRRFAVGSFMDVTSLKVEGQNIVIDPPEDTPKFSMSVYFNIGSCPYLLVYNSQKEYWLELGTILYRKHHKLLQSEEIYTLGENISKIKIEERDKEITYLEYLSILYTEPQTNIKREAIPSLTDLVSQEEGYFILRQGQSIEINLENIIPVNALDVKLKINGYYEILNEHLTSAVSIS